MTTLIALQLLALWLLTRAPVAGCALHRWRRGQVVLRCSVCGKVPVIE